MFNKAQELEKKYSEMDFESNYDVCFQSALAEIDYFFNVGEITQREWARLYQIIS